MRTLIIGVVLGVLASWGLRALDAVAKPTDTVNGITFAVGAKPLVSMHWLSGDQFPRPDETVTIAWKSKEVMRCGPAGCVSLLPRAEAQGPPLQVAKVVPKKLAVGDTSFDGCNTCTYHGGNAWSCTLLACFENDP